jgi:hypothetical protein
MYAFRIVLVYLSTHISTMLQMMQNYKQEFLIVIIIRLIH